MRTEICNVLRVYCIFYEYIVRGKEKRFSSFFVYNKNISIFVANNKMNPIFSDNGLLIDFGLVEY